MAVSRRSSSLTFDPQQQQAIEHVSGPLLVIAGAGTGKTTVLTRRIASLIRERHAQPGEILALTYTINAANEMRERVERELGSVGSKGLQVCTFHAYCHNLLVQAGRSFDVIDDKQLWVFLRRNIRELKLNYFVKAANVSKFLDDLLDFIRRCHDELVGPEQYTEYVRRIERGELPIPRVAKSKHADELSPQESLGRCREIAYVYAKVEEMLHARDLGTFGHMIVYANELLATNAEILSTARGRAKFILVDEFQDANFAQIEVLHKLAGPFDSGSGLAGRTTQEARSTQNIFAVGDPDQGIYRFRGASSGAFDLFLQRFPDAKVIALTKNRRSTTPILQTAHAVIAQNPRGVGRTFLSDKRSTESSFEKNFSRSPLLSARDEEDAIKATQRAPVEAVLVSGPFMEATDLVRTMIERRRRLRCRWKDFAILYRSHIHREEVAAELGRNNIPFSIEGLDVMDTPEVRDLLACAVVVVSPADSAALFRVAALRRFAMDPNALRAAIRTIPRNTDASIVTVLPQVPGGGRLLDYISQVRHQITDKKAHPALLSLTSAFELPRNPAIKATLTFAESWEKSPLTQTGTLAEFLGYLDYFREARGTISVPASEDDDTVKLMTAHSAKGLEFDHVFVLRAVTQSFPAAYKEPLIDFPVMLRKSPMVAGSDDKSLCEQEERRLFYVAMTRARDTLTIYAPFGRGKTDQTPPGYLRELLKNRELKPWLKQRTCREYQTNIFAAAEPVPLTSRLAEWVALAPASDLATTLSASAIDSYKVCPLRFKLEREWRIPAEVSAALQYGASMHRVLRNYYDSVRYERELSDDEVIEQFRSDLAEAGIADHYQRELYENQGTIQLREFLSAARAQRREVLQTEQSFTMKVGSTTLVGRIDRIDRIADDRVVVIDYKTGKPKSQEDADESLQLSLYALAAREKFGYVPERLAFHNLEGNIVITTHRSAAALDEARLQVEEIAGKIAAGKFDATPGFHCNFCAYRGLCPRTEKRLPEAAKAASDQAI